MSKPYVGQAVTFYPSGVSQVTAGVPGRPGTIAYVHSEGCVNVGYLDEQGKAQNATSVKFLKVGETIPTYNFCCVGKASAEVVLSAL